MTVAAVMAAIQTEASDAQSGMSAPTYPPESIIDGGPISIVVPTSFETRVHGDGDTQIMETWTLQVHFTRANADLATVTAAVAPFGENFIVQCRNNPTLGGAVEVCFQEEMTGTFGGMTYGAMPTLGWSIEIHTKRRI